MLIGGKWSWNLAKLHLNRRMQSSQQNTCQSLSWRFVSNHSSGVKASQFLSAGPTAEERMISSWIQEDAVRSFVLRPKITCSNTSAAGVSSKSLVAIWRANWFAGEWTNPKLRSTQCCQVSALTSPQISALRHECTDHVEDSESFQGRQANRNAAIILQIGNPCLSLFDEPVELTCSFKSIWILQKCSSTTKT